MNKANHPQKMVAGDAIAKALWHISGCIGLSLFISDVRLHVVLV